MAKTKFSQKKTLMIVGVVIVVLVIVLVVLLLLSPRGTVDKVVPQALQLKGDVSEVALKTEYQNPFDRDSQYVNPFDEFKSPFQSLQQ
ncbi:MAG TPA: hypothetical protein VJC05_03665 [Candidatus Andersenbacteria bacterium]|nr:hypothetical protein [Candidatus Andersenbacteria bacterium]